MASSGSKLSEEQKRRIEENRRKALERRNQRRQINVAGSRPVTGIQSRTNCAENGAVKRFSSTEQNAPLFQDRTTKERDNTNSIISKLANTRLPTQIQSEDKNSEKTADNNCQNTGANNCSTYKFYLSAKSKVTTSTTDSHHPRACTSIASTTDSIYQMKRKNHDNSLVNSKHSSSIQFQNFSHNQECGREYGREQKQLSSMTCPSEKAIKGYCVLISRKRFSVNVGYHPQLIGVFKTIKSRSYGEFLSF